MNTEAEIAAELAKKLEQPEQVPPPTSKDPEPSKDEDRSFHNSLPLENSLEKMQLLDYFQVPQASRHTAEIAQWINDVMEWAKDESGSSEYTDMLRVISDQERVMGNKLKPDRLLRLRQYVKIHRQRMQLIEHERALYG